MENKLVKTLPQKSFYLAVLGRLNRGTNLSNIQKNLGTSKQKLNYYLQKLVDLGYVEKKGRGWYEPKQTFEHASKKSKDNIRGHAFIWRIKLNQKYNWKERLDRLKIKYKLVRGCIPRIIFNNKKIWLCKEIILIYDSNSYYGRNALESRNHSAIGLMEQLEALGKELEVYLLQCKFTPSREHFALIKNDLAIQCNRNEEKINVYDEKDGEWFWLDASDGLGELETGGKGVTQDRAALNMDVQYWWNDQKKHKFKVTPTFIMDSIAGITKNQGVFDANMMSHLEVLENIGKAITQLKDEVKKINGKT